MKNKILILLFSLLFVWGSCLRKRDYHIQGTLLNTITNNGSDMGGERVALYRMGSNATFNIFSNPNKIVLEGEDYTDEQGRFDFGIKELKEGDYRVDYPETDKNSDYDMSKSFKDITLGRGKDWDVKIYTVPDVKGVNFYADPHLSINSNDTILVEVKCERRLLISPTDRTIAIATGSEIHADPNHEIGGTPGYLMGRYFIFITKSYNGNRTYTYDTIFVKRDELYKYKVQF